MCQLLVNSMFEALKPNLNFDFLQTCCIRSYDDDDDDDDDEGRINFSVALSPKTTRTCKNKPKQWSAAGP